MYINFFNFHKIWLFNFLIFQTTFFSSHEVVHYPHFVPCHPSRISARAVARFDPGTAVSILNCLMHVLFSHHILFKAWLVGVVGGWGGGDWAARDPRLAAAGGPGEDDSWAEDLPGRGQGALHPSHQQVHPGSQSLTPIEVKAKVVAAAWGTVFIQFLAAH